jgi:hypothetical protein
LTVDLTSATTICLTKVFQIDFYFLFERPWLNIHDFGAGSRLIVPRKLFTSPEDPSSRPGTKYIILEIQYFNQRKIISLCSRDISLSHCLPSNAIFDINPFAAKLLIIQVCFFKKKHARGLFAAVENLFNSKIFGIWG